MLFWFCVDRLHAVGPDGAPTNTYDAISLQITILGIILTAMAIGLGVASIFGYQALRESMLTRADQLVNERLQQHPIFKGGVAGGTSKPSIPPAGEVTEEKAAL
jgi:hypothetical protein